MSFGFSRSDRARRLRFPLRFRRGLDRVLDEAAREAGNVGIDSLHLLSAVLRRRKVAAHIAELALDPAAISVAVRFPRKAGAAAPGLTEDAKAAIEAMGHRALASSSEPDVNDLLVGLADADCEARQVLHAQGVTLDVLLVRLS